MTAARQLVIAIDGPAGSGKSTIAARLAKKLGYVNLESGGMYRALALKALEQQVNFDDAAVLRRLADTTVIDLEPQPDGMCHSASVRVTLPWLPHVCQPIRGSVRSWSTANARWAPTAEW